MESLMSNHITKRAESAILYAEMAERNLVRAANRLELELVGTDTGTTNVVLSLQNSLRQAKTVVTDGIEAAREAVA